VSLVVRQGMIMAVGGVLTGSVLAFGMAGLMSGLLYGVSPQDPTTFAAVTAMFAGIALLACWIPALRAARIRPSQALRHEGG
jgi:putative ABC transport system permease protein